MVFQRILSWHDFYNSCKDDIEQARSIISTIYNVYGRDIKFVKFVRDMATDHLEFYLKKDKEWKLFPVDFWEEKFLEISNYFYPSNLHFSAEVQEPIHLLAMPLTYFESFISSFAAAVKLKKAKPLDYKDYKKIQSLIAWKDSTVFIETNLSNKAIFKTSNRTVNIPLSDYPTEEKTFRDFLKEEFADTITMTDYGPATLATIASSTEAVTANDSYYYATTTTPNNIIIDSNSDNITIDPKYFTYGPITLQTNTIDNNTLEKKENKKMKGFNFDFGPVKNDSIRMSMYGLAIKNLNGTWVSYNTTTNDIIDVDVFNFDGSKFLYKIPVAISEIAVGDVVIHMGKPMFVVDISEAGEIMAIDVVASEKKIIMPVRSPFGFNFCTKIVSLFNMTNSMPTPDAPFGNMLPFFLMDGEETDMSSMAMLMMLNSSNGASNPMTANPMMMYLLAKSDNKDMLPLMFFMNNNNK